MMSWDDFWTEILPVIEATPEFWLWLDYYSFADDGVHLGEHK